MVAPIRVQRRRNLTSLPSGLHGCAPPIKEHFRPHPPQSRHAPLGVCESVHPVHTSNVIFANYDLILSDFPWLEDYLQKENCHAESACEFQTTGLCERDIDAWLVQRAGILSVQQAAQSRVNTTVECGPVVGEAIRPPMYGRALIRSAAERPIAKYTGWLDIKGCGVAPGRDPTQDAHSNGLEAAGEALADCVYGWVIDRILRRENLNYDLLPIYAVLDLGFNVVEADGRRRPAALHIRRAVERSPGSIAAPLKNSDEERIGLHIELLIRSAGLTSTSDGHTMSIYSQDGRLTGITHLNGRQIYRFDAAQRRSLEVLQAKHIQRIRFVNVQLADGACWPLRRGTIVDLGSFRAARGEPEAVATIVRDRPLGIGSIVWVESAEGAGVLPTLDSRLAHRPNLVSRLEDLVNKLRHGTIDREGITRELRRTVDQLYDHCVRFKSTSGGALCARQI